MKRSHLKFKILLITTILSMGISISALNTDNNMPHEFDNVEMVDNEPFFLGLDEDGNIINMYTPDTENVLEAATETVYEVVEGENNNEVATFKTMSQAQLFVSEMSNDEPVIIDETKPQLFTMFSLNTLNVQPTEEDQDIVDEKIEHLKQENNPIVKQDSPELDIIAKTTEVNIEYGVVNFRTKTVNNNTNYINVETNQTGYLNGQYGADAAFLGYDNDRVLFRMAGIKGSVPKSEVVILEYTNNMNVSRYVTSKDRLFHGIVTDLSETTFNTTQDVGARPNYLEADKVYYSYDGHYFYTDYKVMIDDYKADTFNKAINKNEPFYNYFQYLSHRSISGVTASEINTYINTRNAEAGRADSKLVNTGAAFVENEAKYGTNALLMLGVAINESGWGTSRIAREYNNLFGHNAYDSDPSAATGYGSVAFSIYHHAASFISDGYLDPCDGATFNGNFAKENCPRGRYYGANLGDESTGMNVKYASDPYWGEKAAAQIHVMTRRNAVKNLKTETIGIKSGTGTINIRQEPRTSTIVQNQTRTNKHFSFKILGQVTGDSVNGNNIWYKVQSDPVLTASRDKLVQNTNGVINTYNMNTMYGYVHSEYVHILDNKPVEVIPDPVEPPKPTYKLGDINNTGGIDFVDMGLMQAHVKKIKLLTGDQFKAADIDKNGVIDFVDMGHIQAHVKGIKKIQGW